MLVRWSNCCGKMKKIRVSHGEGYVSVNPPLPPCFDQDRTFPSSSFTHTHHELKLFPHYIFILRPFSLLIRTLIYTVRNISDMTYHAESLQVLVRAELTPPPSLTRLFLVTCFKRFSWLFSVRCYFKHLTRNRHI